MDREEALAAPFSNAERKAQGMYFTPAPLVADVLQRALERMGSMPLGAVVDPACGAGAFLAAAAARLPGTPLFGLELSEDALGVCQTRVPGATLHPGDALRGGFERLLAGLPQTGAQLWIGNPPYNGTSPLLANKPAYAALLGKFRLGQALPPGTSLRDDYVFFLLLAAQALADREGVLAFVTPSTLLDAFLYAPVRAFLLQTLELTDVLDLGPGIFHATRVKTCVTLWRSSRSRRGVPRFESGGQVEPLEPKAPAFSLRPRAEAAEALDRRWRENGEPLPTLLRAHFPGLKTRFDELLVDDDAEVLLARMDAFLKSRDLVAFAGAHGLPEALLPKLRALHQAYRGPAAADGARIRRHFRYAGARHRGGLPDSARAFCYLDRALIPRGDHRLQGRYDPHLGAVKLVFNTRELPLAALLLEEAGTVHAHRHARFAPLEIPERVWSEGVGRVRRTPEHPLGPLVPNLSLRGRELARALGGPRALFAALARFINSPDVQEVWAPAFGTTCELPIPLDPVTLGQASHPPAPRPLRPGSAGGSR